jgi:L-cystine uptake protein TcyP (sodium:dicarboxylate symporter family)
LNLVGVALTLYVFMADAIRAAGGGAEAVRHVLPTQFNWPVFVVAVLLLAAPIVDLCWQQWGRRLTEEPDGDRLDGSRGP